MLKAINKADSVRNFQRHKIFQIENSVIRRSLLVFCLTVPGYFLNLGLLLIVNKIISVPAFGIFYTALSSINVLTAPGIFIGLFAARHMTQNLALHGPEAVGADFKSLIVIILKWGAVLSPVLALFTAFSIKVESLEIILLIVFCSYLTYITETVRTTFQGLHMFIWFGLTGLTWMTLRFVFVLTGIWSTEKVWPGLVGMALATTIVFLIFYPKIRKKTESHGGEIKSEPLVFRKMPLFMAGYGLFVALTYMDVILAYFTLDRIDLGIYSKYCILPKAFLMLLMPVLQVFFPMIANPQSDRRLKAGIVLRGAFLTGSLSVLMVLALIVLKEYVCPIIISVEKCQFSIMAAAAWSAVPLALIRLMIMVQFARGLDWHPLLLLVPAGGFLFFWLWARPDGIEGLAFSYLGFNIIMFLYYLLLTAVSGFRGAFIRIQAGKIGRPEA